MIRQAQTQDAAAIRDCAVHAYSPYIPRIGRAPAPMHADFEAQIAAGAVYIATDDSGAFQGFIVFFAVGQHVLLENIAILPSVAGRGIGAALIRFCEDEARRRGYDAVHLYTNEKMTENLALYPRLGYAEVARRTEDGFHRVYFEKRLSV